MKKLLYYIFAIRWLWLHRHWTETRQKFKAMNRDYQAYLRRKANGY